MLPAGEVAVVCGSGVLRRLEEGWQMGCQPAGVSVPFFSSLLGIWSLKSRVGGGGQEATEKHVAATIVTHMAVTKDRAQANISG